MNTKEELLTWARVQIFEHPSLKEEIMDFVKLAFDEIESGESKQNEISLCVESINELIEEQKEKK